MKLSVEDRMDRLSLGICAVRIRLSKINRNHVPSGPKGGQFASGSGGGGIASGGAPEAKPDKSTPDAKPSSGSSYVKKPTYGNKPEADALVTSLGDADKTFKGDLGKFLEKYPLDKVTVMKDARRDPMLYRGAEAHYSGGAITVRPQSQSLMGPGSPSYYKGTTENVGDNLPTAKGRQSVAFLHEVGHHVFETVDAKTLNRVELKAGTAVILVATAAWKKGAKTAPSDYAKTSVREYFSEAFAAYHFEPGKLDATSRKLVETVMARAKGI